MKKLMLLTVVTCFMMVSVYSQQNGHTNQKPVETVKPVEAPKPLPKANPAPNPNAPEFKFEEEIHDFGTVPEGPKAVYEFSFENIGKEPLIIKSARASCGCTVPVWPREPILPGEKDIIRVSYNTQGRPGTINKTITITSNAKTPTKHIRIKGKVTPKPKGPAGSPEKQPAQIEAPKK